MTAATAAVLLVAPLAVARADTFVADNTNDSGAGSLRQAIAGANAAAGGPSDLVDATGVTGEIALQTALPNLTGSFEIRGPGASALTVSRATGEFRIFTVDAGAKIVLAGLTIANGLTPAMDFGGGILNSGNVTVLRSAVSGNSGHTGGGIRNNAGGVLTVRGSTVSGNTARQPSGGGEGGAGISNAAGTVAVVNSTVSGNTTGGRGGGIINSVQAAPNSSTVTITNSTIAANAGSGANLFNSTNGGTAVLSYRSTIVSNPLGGASNCGGAGGGSLGLTSQGYNLADDDSCNLSATADQPSTEPQLGPLATTGGPTWTMAPPMGSPAVDKGIGDGLTTDQRGLARPVDFPQIPNAPGGDGADIGAFELQAPPPTPPPPPAPPRPPAPNGQPSNEFSFVKVRKNLKRGTAKLTVRIKEGPGELRLAKTMKVKPARKQPQAAGAVELEVKPRGKSRKRLRRTGKARVRARVTYAPDGGDPKTMSKRIKLKKRR